MTDEQKAAMVVKAAKDEAQRLVNEADRPRLRALELEAQLAPGYWSRQTHKADGTPQQLGHWTIDGRNVE